MLLPRFFKINVLVNTNQLTDWILLVFKKNGITRCKIGSTNIRETIANSLSGVIFKKGQMKSILYNVDSIVIIFPIIFKYIG